MTPGECLEAEAAGDVVLSPPLCLPSVCLLGCRYVSFTTGDAVPLYSSYNSKADYEFAEFYGGAEEWNRGYSIIAAIDEDTAMACKNLYDPNRDVLLTFQKHPLQEPKQPLIVMREILNKGYLAAAATQRQQAQACSTNMRGDPSCLTTGGNSSGPIMHTNQIPPQAILQEYYPKVELFNCDTASGFSVQVY